MKDSVRQAQSPAGLKVEDLRFRYPGNSEDTLKGISFKVEPGEIYGFLGPNGAGKSTTQHILIGLLSGFEGEVELLGCSLRDWRREMFNYIGVSFEDPNLYGKLTAKQNLELFSSFYDVPTPAPMKLLEEMQLSDDADRLVETFSKGMKMRLNVCRAMLPRPRFLFLDEPTSGLDPLSARRMKDFILEQKEKGTTIFLTTHNMEVATQLCDRVAFIAEGQIVAGGSPADLMLGAAHKTVQVEISDNNKILYREFPLESLGENSAFIEFLKSGELRRIHSQEASLEEVFLQVAGRKP